jgi:excisionase family DNA binding protein
VSTTPNAIGERITGGETATCEQAAMLDVQAVARLLNCSARHVYRLADMGRLPRPVKLGALVRWNRVTVEQWIADGCPSCRNGGAR